MSFSSEVKEELSRHLPTARHCQIAETAAILSLCGQISEKDGTIRIQTENAYVARKYFTLLKKTFNIEAELAVKLNQKENTYLIRVNDREETRQILQAVKLHETDRQLTMPIPAVVVQRQCCKRAFLRGAFLASGSISDPNRFYHLEIVCPDAPRAECAVPWSDPDAGGYHCLRSCPDWRAAPLPWDCRSRRCAPLAVHTPSDTGVHAPNSRD